jgi:hypothetical protein
MQRLCIASEDVGGVDQICLGIWDHSAENTGAAGDVVACVRRKQQFLCVIHQQIQ